MSRERQSFVERPPAAALADLVASTWVQQIAPDGEPYTHRNTPNGGVDVICAVGGVPRVIGARTGPLVDVLGETLDDVGPWLSMRSHTARSRRRWAWRCSPPTPATPISRI